jgi:pyruvate dehydrogenase E2 component (dihydrolipoamide acetyltransferase)
MEDGVILNWLKNAGDAVTPGEVLAEIETDKAIMELEAYEAGILERVLVGAGQRVAVGVPIAVIGDGSRTVAVPPIQVAAPTPADPVRAASADRADRPKASPLARKIATEVDVDLSTIIGSGPGGRIVRRDVESAAAALRDTENPCAARPMGGDSDEIRLTTLQQVAAKRLTESKQNAPHFYLTAAVDVTELLAFRDSINAGLAAADGPKVSINDLLVRAVALALHTNPALNVSFGGAVLRRHRGVHIGVTVAVDAGLVVPVVRDADRKTVPQIALETKELAGRARTGKLRADEMSGGTFTVSNLGMYGIEQFAAVINPPEAAILAVGAAVEEVRLIGGEVVARNILRATLSADHRALDGSTAATFLQDLTRLLEHPLQLVV